MMSANDISKINLNGTEYNVKDAEALKITGNPSANEIVISSSNSHEVVASGTSLTDIFSRIDAATVIENVDNGEWIINIVNDDGSVDMSAYYSKSRVDGLISDAVGALDTELRGIISGLQRVTVQIESSLPLEGATNIIYFIPKTGDTNDTYDEYMWISGAWEHIGSTDVDLSGYATENYVNSQGFAKTSQLPTKVSDLNNDTGFITAASLSGLATYSWVQDQNYASASSVPTDVSDLNNDTGFITISDVKYVEIKNSTTEQSNYTGAQINEMWQNRVPMCYDKGVVVGVYGPFGDQSLDVMYLGYSLSRKSQLEQAQELNFSRIYIKQFSVSLNGYTISTPVLLGTTVRIGDSNRLIGGQVASDNDSFVSGSQVHQALRGYATTNSIPTKVSDLTNDSGYATQNWVSSQGFAASSAVPTATSDLTNDSGFLTLSDVLPMTQTKYTEIVDPQNSNLSVYTGSEVASMWGNGVPLTLGGRVVVDVYNSTVFYVGFGGTSSQPYLICYAAMIDNATKEITRTINSSSTVATDDKNKLSGGSVGQTNASFVTGAQVYAALSDKINKPASPSNGDVLTYSPSSGWVASAPSAPLPSGTTSGDMLVWDGTEWDVTAVTIPSSGTISSGATGYATGGDVYAALADKQDTLTFDNSPTASSDNPVKSGGVYTALSDKISAPNNPSAGDVLTYDSTNGWIADALSIPSAGTIASGSTGYATGGDVYTALSNKQDTLTFDNSPTQSSDNPVKSGGIYTALGDKISAPSSPSAGNVLTYRNGAWGAEAPNGGFVVSTTAPSDTGVLWIDPSDTNTDFADGDTSSY